jgi:hypothetical protein
MQAGPEKRLRDPRGNPLQPDSAVTLYWDPRPLDPGQSRTVGFTYGLGRVSSGEARGQLLLTLGGRLVREGEFTLTALVSNPVPGETLTLDLPAGLSIREGAPTLSVPPVPPGSSRPISTLTWKLSASRAGSFKVAVKSSRGTEQATTIPIRSSGVFD